MPPPLLTCGEIKRYLCGQSQPFINHQSRETTSKPPGGTLDDKSYSSLKKVRRRESPKIRKSYSQNLKLGRHFRVYPENSAHTRVPRIQSGHVLRSSRIYSPICNSLQAVQVNLQEAACPV